MDYIDSIVSHRASLDTMERECLVKEFGRDSDRDLNIHIMLSSAVMVGGGREMLECHLRCLNSILIVVTPIRCLGPEKVN
jgi:hypothetical protein